MTETKMLIGSLSNDLSRVANMMYKKSPSAETFFHEMFRWIKQLEPVSVKPYIRDILSDIKSHERNPEFSQKRAETYLMYSILLQNFSLHIQ